MIDAPYGHDCFLLEEARQTPLIRQFLSNTGWESTSDPT